MIDIPVMSRHHSEERVQKISVSMYHIENDLFICMLCGKPLCFWDDHPDFIFHISPIAYIPLPPICSFRADSAKMTQPMRGDQAHQPASARKSASLSSPSAARRLYRNLSGKFRVGTNPPTLEDSVVSGRGGDKERLRKTTIVSKREREGKNNKPRNIVV